MNDLQKRCGTLAAFRDRMSPDFTAFNLVAALDEFRRRDAGFGGIPTNSSLPSPLIPDGAQ